MINPPCRDCKNRNINCHAKCEKYIEYRKQLDEFNRKQRIIYDSNRIADEDYHKARRKRKKV